eukprot:2253531-Rhodomonas_salina.2
MSTRSTPLAAPASAPLRSRRSKAAAVSSTRSLELAEVQICAQKRTLGLEFGDKGLGFRGVGFELARGAELRRETQSKRGVRRTVSEHTSRSARLGHSSTLAHSEQSATTAASNTKVSAQHTLGVWGSRANATTSLSKHLTGR